MRSLFLFLLSLFSITVQSQTKQETIDWINSKIPQNPIVFGEIIKEANKMKILPDGTFEISTLYFEIPINPFNPKIETTITVRGNFKNLSPSSVTLIKKERYYFISINCNNNKECLEISRSGKEGIDHAKNGLSFGAFDAEETNIGGRLKKAFIHLINISGGKKETF